MQGPCSGACKTFIVLGFKHMKVNVKNLFYSIKCSFVILYFI